MTAMRINCPNCGMRDLREFSIKGADVSLYRPDADAVPEAWNDYIHLRENPAGPTRELWYHDYGCTGWLVVHRNTVTHEITDVVLASEARS
jgi:heterotetrameric sarcosine oxidase delta subunit